MKKGQYLKGLLFLVLVNCILVGSSVLTKNILDHDFQKPLFLTYCSAAMYTVCLVPYLPLIFGHCTSSSNKAESDDLIKSGSITKVSLDNVNLPKRRSEKYAVEPSNEKVLSGQMIPVVGQSHYAKPISPVELTEQVTFCFFVVKQSSEKIPLLETIKISGMFGSILFGMNYVFNASMVYTTQGTSTVLSTLSGPFCLTLSIIFLKEPVVWSNMLGVAMVLGGSIVIAYLDMRTQGDEIGGDKENYVGDIFAILAAFVYGCYSVLMKFWIKEDNRLSMFLYLGLVGFWNLIGLWPLFFLLDDSGWETFYLPDTKTIGFLAMTGFLNLLFEICWTRSILLISPTIASIGLGLSVPLGLLADYVVYGIEKDFKYILGAVCVVAGFVLANLKMQESLEQDSDLQKPLCTEELSKDKEVA